MELYQAICFTISLVIFQLYFVWIYSTFGIQSSISNSFYVIWKKRPHEPNLRWWFTGALWGFAFPLAIIGVEIHPLFWLAAVLIMFVGAAPAFKSTRIQNTVHMVGAIGGIGAAMIAFFLLGQYLIFGLTVGAMALVGIKRFPNTTWWVETIAFVGTWFGLLILTL
jgi:hypothetical protein